MRQRIRDLVEQRNTIHAERFEVIKYLVVQMQEARRAYEAAIQPICDAYDARP